MPSSHLDTIRRCCHPLVPIPTDREPVLRSLSAIEAVMFDVYGTLFISASGDVGTSMSTRCGDAFGEALAAVGVKLSASVECVPADDLLVASIQTAHEESRAAGVEYPEVDIVQVWAATLQRLFDQGLLAERPDGVDLAQLAVEYEVRTNPTWPMPAAADCLAELEQRRLRLGIVSNAQFFTRELFPALLDKTTDQLGFDPQLQFYSYAVGWAKPGTYLYEQAAEALSAADIPARNVLYIGNDMLNDVAAARQVGFRTALFAGDKRSLRLREADQRVRGIEPDLVLTDLAQVADCIE